jgi:CDP-glucose 4,6-dehydratase
VQCVRSVVVVTSDKCYEYREADHSYREAEAMDGYDPYSSSKGCAELVTSAYRQSFFTVPDGRVVGVATARAGNVIGGGDWAKDRLLPDCMRALSGRSSIEIRNPSAVRPWQHVLEPLRGYLLLAERLNANAPTFGSAWNFGPVEEDARSVAWVVSRVVDQWGQGAAWHSSNAAAPYELASLKLDASRARALLGWSPRLRLADGLAWTVAWRRRLNAGEAARELTEEQLSQYCEMAA